MNYSKIDDNIPSFAVVGISGEQMYMSIPTAFILQYKKYNTKTSAINSVILVDIVSRSVYFCVTSYYMITYNRPTEYNIDNNKVFAEMSIARPIYIKETGRLVDIHISPVLIETELQEDGSLPLLPISPEIFSDDKYEKFNKLTYSLGKINRLAESNLDRLQYFIRYFFGIVDFKEFVTTYKKCNDQIEYDITDNFNKLSFMQLKNLLSCVIKSDTQFHDIEELNSGEKRNFFTRTYANYVYDRDCFTHGQLYFHYPDFNPILRVKPPGKKEHYILLTEDVLWDNLLVYQFLEDTITKLNEKLDKNNGK